MSKSLCIITPTIGRPTLERTLTSAKLSKNDEWLVIGDGPQSFSVVDMVEKLGSPYSYIEHPKNNDCGNALKNFGMAISDKDYFLFLDDDDIFTPDAIELVRHYTEQTNGPIIFRMITPQGETIWKDQIITPGNVGSGMVCFPNIFNKLGKYGTGYSADFFFIEQTVKKWQGQITWAGEIITICQPEKQPERQ